MRHHPARVVAVVGVLAPNIRHPVGLRFRLSGKEKQKKQAFLLEHGSTDVLFSSCEDTIKTMAENLVTAERILVPQCDWLWAGWPCVNKSKANNKRGEYKR